MLDVTPYLEQCNEFIEKIIKARCVKKCSSYTPKLIRDGEVTEYPTLVVGKIYTVAVCKVNFFCKGKAYYVLELDNYEARKDFIDPNLPKGILATVPFWDSADGYFEEIPNSIDYILED